jgi:signal transduction histidine kinase
VLEHTLLQLFLALVPVFAFLIWYDRPDRQKGASLFISSFSAIALILCMVLSTRLGNGLDWDNRTIPYILGSLYGGYAGAIGMTAIYIGMRLLYLDSQAEIVGLICVAVFVAPLVVAAAGRFKRAKRAWKMRMALLILLMYNCLFMAIVAIYRYPSWESGYQQFYWIILYMAWAVCILMAAVYLIEGAKEKLQLQQQLQTMSNNYRNAVQKLQQFIDLTPLGVVLVDQHGIITHINDQAIRFIRSKNTIIDRMSLTGRPYTALSDGTKSDVDCILIRQALLGDGPCREVVEDSNRIHLKTGFTVRDVATNAIIGAAVISHDITEVTRLKDEITRVERLSLVGQMAASITHEIRNPMAVIRGFIQLMRERSPNHQHEYYRIIMEELDRANSIINDFLSLAQNRVVEMEYRSLHDILNDLSPLLWADANMRGQSIELDLCEQMPAIEMNEKEMKQMILNLARNGMEAMTDKGQLTLRTRVTAENRIELHVSDTGTGIAADKLSKLFEPFFTTKSRGTGLGLPLCLSIVERHNGKIEVQSVEGSGTTFIVSFVIGNRLKEEA